MRIKTKAHYQALTDLVELMSVASLIALLADVIWVIRDSIVGGFTFTLGVVGGLLITALVGMAYGVYKYHHKAVRIILHDVMEAKFRHCKRNRKSEVQLIVERNYHN